MDVETAKKLLGEAGYGIQGEQRLANNSGVTLRLESGEAVNVFDTGNFNVQGRGNIEAVKALLSDAQPGTRRARPATREVFVVYGHDGGARTELEAMLRRWDLNPLFLDQLPSEGMTLIEKLERYRGAVEFAVVLATPDDEGHRAGHTDENAFRARQNVVLELGMLLATLGRPRVAILLKAQETMERPSDIQGLIYIPFKEHVAEVALQLAKEMQAQGLAIDLARI